MRFCLCLAVLLAASTVWAQDNKLTPEEIAAGWLLLFDGETTFGWQPDNSVKAVDGKLQIKADAKKPVVARTSAHIPECDVSFEYAVAGSFSLQGAQGNVKFKSEFKGPSPKESKSSKGGFSGRLPAGPEWSVPADSVVYLKNVKLRPGKMKTLFNGKDLTGWQEFPGKKSKFTVTPQGEINIKNGPGDLQTIDKYGDFCLQLECISNGKHLNSGVFFRCRPHEYQNGYEAQIRNQFTPEPTQDYTLEEYDPATHKLLTKKKAKFSAVDYGTGAIYRRQPARKEVAKDGEWFKFTILAHKNHFATWVNGIQVADWTDNRPPSDNARNGCRLEAGHISLQGHDPTTDLSFRNIRIAEIK